MSDKSYRSVLMCPVDAMSSAASYLSREWGDNYYIGYVAQYLFTSSVVNVFQCVASDGSRFLIYSDRWGNTGTFNKEDEARIALELDVEVS